MCRSPQERAAALASSMSPTVPHASGHPSEPLQRGPSTPFFSLPEFSPPTFTIANTTGLLHTRTKALLVYWLVPSLVQELFKKTSFFPSTCGNVPRTGFPPGWPTTMISTEVTPPHLHTRWGRRNNSMESARLHAACPNITPFLPHVQTVVRDNIFFSISCLFLYPRRGSAALCEACCRWRRR